MVVPVGDSTPLVLRLLEVKSHFLLQGLLRELVTCKTRTSETRVVKESKVKASGGSIFQAKRQFRSQFPLPIPGRSLLQAPFEGPNAIPIAGGRSEDSGTIKSRCPQIASQSSDPMLELGAGTLGGGPRGPQGRAKLQAELAAQKGVFFQSVSAAEGTPEEMMARGISALDIWRGSEVLESTESWAASCTRS